jgi:hypothetical protein
MGRTTGTPGTEEAGVQDFGADRVALDAQEDRSPELCLFAILF